MNGKWHLVWIVGAILIIPAIFFWSRDAYFCIDDQGHFRSVYISWEKAQCAYLLTLTATYYAVFVVVSLLAGRLSPRERNFHLGVWIMGPPLWFSFEWNVFFDNFDSPTAIDRLKYTQDLGSKFWAAIVALIFSLRLGEAMTSKRDNRQRTMKSCGERK